MQNSVISNQQFCNIFILLTIPLQMQDQKKTNKKNRIRWENENTGEHMRNNCLNDLYEIRTWIKKTYSSTRKPSGCTYKSVSRVIKVKETKPNNNNFWKDSTGLCYKISHDHGSGCWKKGMTCSKDECSWNLRILIWASRKYQYRKSLR